MTAPKPKFNQGTYIGTVGIQVTVGVAVTLAPHDVITSWMISWGDGHVDSGVSVPANAFHTYASAGAYVARFTVTDASDLSACVQANVQIKSVPTPPPPATLTITCPGNVSIVSPDGNPVAVTFPNATTTGGTLPVNVVSVPASGTLFAVGVTTVHVTATSADSQTAPCSFTVTVTAAPTPPAPLVITCPAPISVVAKGPTTVSFTPHVSGGTGPITLVSSPASGSVFPVGTSTVNVSASSADGQHATCAFTVTVTLPVVPTLTIQCNAPITVASPDGNPVVVTFPDPTTTGGTAPVSLSSVPASGSSFPVGVNTVICTATSADGQGASCSFTVTVTAPAPPPPPPPIPPATLTLTCPSGPITTPPSAGATVVTFPAPVTTGGQAPVVVTATPPSGSVFPLGLTTVNVTATSADGQVASCSFQVDVIGLPPIAPLAPTNPTILP